MVAPVALPAIASSHGERVVHPNRAQRARRQVQAVGIYRLEETAGCHKRHARWCERRGNPPTRSRPNGAAGLSPANRTVDSGNRPATGCAKRADVCVCKGARSIHDGRGVDRGTGSSCIDSEMATGPGTGHPWGTVAGAFWAGSLRCPGGVPGHPCIRHPSAVFRLWTGDPAAGIRRPAAGHSVSWPWSRLFVPSTRSGKDG